ncbi:sulfurtransferase complex subunit TusB [Methylococcus sp. EFPC2]|uniref:sulfurtransferase complex subunit TusB n=1 Tax=Methylococcus sp. EFPC2 TaxID=2812648 RepID=UPI001967817E|nr:sulfurtransferase complex subunit TusB [Methylococcus sp. EFPC2]QSA98526.1 sulfurtransferase complex subunit TusB [Methylococcus sp. EFPC2]
MAVLHLLYRSPAESSTWSQCWARTGREDAVLLLEDAVYAVAMEPTLEKLAAASKIFILSADLVARGVPSSSLPQGVETVDYAGFVELTERYPLSLSWS